MEPTSTSLATGIILGPVRGGRGVERRPAATRARGSEQRYRPEARHAKPPRPLSYTRGPWGDEGALALLRGGSLTGLRRLDIHHHYVSDEVLDGLKALGIDLDADDRKEAEDDDDARYI